MFSPILITSVLAKLENIKSLNIDQIRQFQETSTELVHLSDKSFALTTYIASQEDGSLLIVVQGFRPTLLFPNFLAAAGGVGHMISEGLILHPSGEITEAPDELLWPFR